MISAINKMQTSTVGAQIPIKFGIQMVQSCSVGEWHLDFEWSAILVWFSNCPDHPKTEPWLA